MTQHFTIQTTGPDYDAVKEGVSWLVSQDSPEGSIAVYSTVQVDVIANILGAPRITKDRRFTAHGMQVKILIKKDWSGYARTSGPVLAVWLDDKQLEAVDQMNPPQMLSIPWLPEKNAQWRAAHGPTDLRTRSAEERKTISDPVVAEAVTHITFNKGTGILHSMDRDRAIFTFRALRKAGISFDSDEIRAWAISDGWDPKHASDLADVARRIGEGRAVRTREGGRGFDADVVKGWRRRAAQRASISDDE